MYFIKTLNFANPFYKSRDTNLAVFPILWTKNGFTNSSLCSLAEFRVDNSARSTNFASFYCLLDSIQPTAR